LLHNIRTFYLILYSLVLPS